MKTRAKLAAIARTAVTDRIVERGNALLDGPVDAVLRRVYRLPDGDTRVLRIIATRCIAEIADSKHRDQAIASLRRILDEVIVYERMLTNKTMGK